jgi:hypothetical protein
MEELISSIAFVRFAGSAFKNCHTARQPNGHARTSSQRRSFSIAAVTVRTTARNDVAHPQNEFVWYQGCCLGGMVGGAKLLRLDFFTMPRVYHVGQAICCPSLDAARGTAPRRARQTLV